MMTEIINEFRTYHNRGYVSFWDSVVSQWCRWHSEEMAKRDQLYHAEYYYLTDWEEIVVMSSKFGSRKEVERKLVFDVIRDSPTHRAILLDSNIMAYGMADTNDKIYRTIRGRR